ncbi:MAG: ISKra4 family transposase [Planctomycetota bacterium]
MIDDAVSRFRNGLKDLVTELDSKGMAPATLAGLVESLKRLLSEVGLQVFVDMVGRHEETADVVQHKGQLHRFKMTSPKEWITPFGLAVVPRRYFQPDRGGEGVVPLDVRCGMVDRAMTPDVEELCAFSVAHLVPREVETLLGKLLPHGPSATAIQHVLQDVAGFAEREEALIESTISKNAPLSKQGDVLVQSWDGVTVPLREAGTKTGRKPERPGVRDTDRTPTAWKEAGVAAISIYRRDAEGKPVRLDTRYLARMPESGMTRLLEQQNRVISHLLDARIREVVLLCDGKDSIWKQAEFLTLFPVATLILDFWHAAEHLAGAAEALFGKKSRRGRRWYETHYKQLRDEAGGVIAVIRSMQYYLNKQGLREQSDRCKTVRRVMAYYRRNAAKMDYAAFKARGLPIGSGPVEAACKTVVGARLKRSGMRWNRDGGQQVLDLRVQVLSKRWNPFWTLYLQQRSAA